MASETKSKQVSTMLKQGFISDSYLYTSPPSKTQIPLSKIHHSSSPPQSPFRVSPTRPSTTLFQMMSEEQARDSKQPHETRRAVQERVAKVLEHAPFKNPGAWGLGYGDVKLSVTARDGFKVSMDVHRSVLSSKSRFFEEKLTRSGAAAVVEICDCDDVEVYVETVVLMYCEDLKRRLNGANVSKILGVLKVSAAILFDAGVTSCLEYLEAVPWSAEEEEMVVSELGQLQLNNPLNHVLQRVSTEPATSFRTDDISSILLSGVLQGKDDKARREMKSLLSRLLKDDLSSPSDHKDRLDISKDALYTLCHTCLSSLMLCLSEATSADDMKQDRGVLMGDIAREADNVQWIVDILIDKKMCDEFVKLWADQKELAILHSKIPIIYRHEISRITAQLCIAIGRGHILVPKDARYSLLSTWLEALYDDFGWMRRASRSVDKKLIEDGLSQTILTLALPQQQAILLNWFDRFLNKGDNCPNIQRAFEVWWRRTFIRQYAPESESRLQITPEMTHELLDAMQAGTLELEVAFLNASTIPDTFPVLAAPHKTLVAKSRESLATRTLHSELVFNYSGSEHIKESFKRCGIT